MKLDTLKRGVLAAGIAVLMAAPLAAQAGAIAGNTAASSESTPTGADYTGFLNYSATSNTSATLAVTLTNTSNPTLVNSFITAFVFNNPSNLITSATLTAKTDPDFFLIGGPSFNNSINAPPFGKFDFGASTGGGFSGSGNPNKGIPIGATETFTFSFTGSGLLALSQESFEAEMSADPQGGGPQFFVARFRGIGPNKDGSDKIPAEPDEPNGQVPEPGTLSLAALGLLGTLMSTRRRRKTNRE